MRGLSSQSQRPVALGLLLAANVLIAAAMPWVLGMGLVIVPPPEFVWSRKREAARG